MAGKKRSGSGRRLFRDPSGQSDMFDKSVEEELDEKEKGRVECLGMTFGSEEERREFFLEKLREKLQDPEFRKTPGFPKGSDEAILRMSDPPWYTACPNPFLTEYLDLYGRSYDSDEVYDREPFAIDVSVGKHDALYRAHGYHTKVPHLAIVPSILHYTKPGDVVLDGFCGSGMTGVAAQWCGRPPREYRKQTEAEWLTHRDEGPVWGSRRSLLLDLSPAATFISANFNLPFQKKRFSRSAQNFLGRLDEAVGWMYATRDPESKREIRFSFVVWSETYACPACSQSFVFVRHALDEKTERVLKEFECPHCNAALNKNSIDLVFETRVSRATGGPNRVPKRVPTKVTYKTERKRQEKAIEDFDLELLERIEKLQLPPGVPLDELPDVQMTRVGRVRTTNTTHVIDFYVTRTLHALAHAWALAREVHEPRT